MISQQNSTFLPKDSGFSQEDSVFSQDGSRFSQEVSGFRQEDWGSSLPLPVPSGLLRGESLELGGEACFKKVEVGGLSLGVWSFGCGVWGLGFGAQGSVRGF